MKNIKKILIAGIIGVVVTSATACNMVARTPESIKKAPVATVNGETITKEQLDKEMAPAIAQNVKQYGADWESNTEVKKAFDDNREKARQSLIDAIVILQHAKTEKVELLDKDIDAEVKTEYDNYVKQYGDEAKLTTELVAAGYDKESFTKALKQQVKLKKAVEGLLKDVKVDEAKIQAEYDANKNTKYTTQPSLIHIQRILLANEADAKAVVERINKGEDFAKVAAEVSKDEATKAKGGDLGDYYYAAEMNQGAFDPSLGEAAKSVGLDKISAPVENSEGWNVIKVTKKEEYPAADFAIVKESITAELLNTLKDETITANIKKWETDLGNKLVKYDKNM